MKLVRLNVQREQLRIPVRVKKNFATFHVFLRTFPFLVAGMAAGCADSMTEVGKDKEPIDPTLQSVLDFGYSLRSVKDMGEYYLVQGDMMFHKSASTVESVLDPGIQQQQYMGNNLVDLTRVNEIKVDLSALSNDAAWLTAARQALAEWSSVAGSNIRMVEGTPAHISTSYYCAADRPTERARASFPGGSGGPGGSVQINSCASSINAGVKIHVFTHELGHTLGFHHTNWQQADGDGCTGTTSSPYGPANHVEGTPTSGNDAGSVMNTCVPVSSWAGFSYYDGVAAKTRYPKPPAITITDLNSQPHITWTATYGATVYQLYLVERTVRYNYGYDEVWNTEGLRGTTSGLSLTDTVATFTGCSSYWPDMWTQVSAWYEVRATYATGVAVGAWSAPVLPCE